MSAAGAPPRTDRPRRECLWAALFFAATAGLLAWTPVRRLGLETLTPSDALQAQPLTCIDPSWQPGRPDALDVAVRHQAAVALVRARLARAELPVWDRCTGLGAPLLGHPDSAPASPFTWLELVLPLDVAALLTVISKTFLAGWLAFLFLRALRLAPVACLFGASAFQLSGTFLEHLQRPSSTVALLLPAGLLVLESVASRIAGGTARTNARRFALDHPRQSAAFLALVVIGIGGGDPQGFVFVALVWLAYALLRASTVRAPELDPRDQRAPVGRAMLQTALVALLGVGVAAFALLPLIEYVRESTALADRSALGPIRGAAGAWVLAACPGLLSEPPTLGAASVANYVGLPVLFLAGLGALLARARRACLFFTWTALVCLVLGASDLLEPVWGLGLLDLGHGLSVLQFSLSACAAFGVHHLATRGPRPSLHAAGASCLAALTLGIVFRAGASRLVRDVWDSSGLAEARAVLLAHAQERLAAAGIWFGVVTLSVAAAWLVRDGRRRSVLLACAVLAVAASGTITGRTRLTTTPNALVNPVTSGLRELADLARTKRVAILGDAALPGRFGALHGIETLENDESLGLARLDELRRALFGGTRWASRRGLELFGVERVLTRDDWVPVDTLTGFATPAPSREYATAPLVPDLQVELDFRCPDERTDALRVCFETRGRPLLQNIELEVSDRTTNERVALRVLSPDFEHPNHAQRVFAVVPLPRQVDWHTRPLRLVVRSNDGMLETAWSLLARDDWDEIVNAGAWRHDGVVAVPYDLEHAVAAEWVTRQGGKRLRGGIVVDVGWNTESLNEVGTLAGLRVLEIVGAVPPYHAVSDVWSATDEDDAFASVVRSTFDPARAVVLEGVAVDSAPTTAPQEPVTLVARDDRATRLTTTRARPGWLVAAEPWYPGRRARVNGRDVPVLRANSAFCAVALPAGASEIVLEHGLTSARTGLAVAFVSLVAAAAWILASRAGSGLSDAGSSS